MAVKAMDQKTGQNDWTDVSVTRSSLIKGNKCALVEEFIVTPLFYPVSRSVMPPVWQQDCRQ